MASFSPRASRLSMSYHQDIEQPRTGLDHPNDYRTPVRLYPLYSSDRLTHRARHSWIKR